MKKIFEKCLELDEKCKSCGNEYFGSPHHIIYRSQGGPDELWNLITLCMKCHEKAHNGCWQADYSFPNMKLLKKVRLAGREFMINLLKKLSYGKDFRWQKALDKLEERK